MFKVLDGATAPTRATKYSAMVDLYANADVVIGAGETKIIPLGVKIDLEKLKELIPKKIYALPSVEADIYYSDVAHNFMESHYLELHPRSSLRAKGLIIGVGIIDLDFPNELCLIVHNPCKPYTVRIQGIDTTYVNRTATYQINKGDKIAQCTLVEHKGYLLGIESEVERVGGFGSSGL